MNTIALAEMNRQSHAEMAPNPRDLSDLSPLRDIAGGAGRAVVCGDEAVLAEVDHMLSAPLDAGAKRSLVSNVYRLLCADRHGEIDAVVFAAPAGARTAVETIRNLRAVIEHAYHDASLVVLSDPDTANDPQALESADIVLRR